LELFAHYEVEVEFALHLFFVWELSEKKLQKVDKAILTVADVNNLVVRKVFCIFLSLLPEIFFQREFFFEFLIHLLV